MGLQGEKIKLVPRVGSTSRNTLYPISACVPERELRKRMEGMFTALRRRGVVMIDSSLQLRLTAFRYTDKFCCISLRCCTMM